MNDKNRGLGPSPSGAGGYLVALAVVCTLGCKNSEAASTDGTAPGSVARSAASATPNVADFESGLRMAGGLDAKAIDDKGMGGVSHATVTVEAPGAAGTAKALHISGDSAREAFPFPFAGAAIPLGPKTADGPAPLDVRSRTGIQLWVKGNGKSYVLRMNSTKVKDYNFHHHSFVASAEWTLVRVPFTELQQYGWGKPVAWTEAATSISSLAIVNESEATGAFGPIDVAVDEIAFY